VGFSFIKLQVDLIDFDSIYCA